MWFVAGKKVLMSNIYVGMLSELLLLTVLSLFANGKIELSDSFQNCSTDIAELVEKI
ncbi:MAG: hypothetical protein AB7G87_02160 [Clostridia bacterium]